MQNIRYQIGVGEICEEFNAGCHGQLDKSSVVSGIDWEVNPP
jgi:hypothetical protein